MYVAINVFYFTITKCIFIHLDFNFIYYCCDYYMAIYWNESKRKLFPLFYFYNFSLISIGFNFNVENQPCKVPHFLLSENPNECPFYTIEMIMVGLGASSGESFAR